MSKLTKDNLSRRNLILIPTPEHIHSGDEKTLAIIVNIDNKDDCVGCWAIHKTGIFDSTYINVWVDDILSTDGDEIAAHVDALDIDAEVWNIGLGEFEKTQDGDDEMIGELNDSFAASYSSAMEEIFAPEDKGKDNE